jgi:hypothetical protein
LKTSEKRRVEADNPCRAEVTKEKKRTPAKDTNGFPGHLKRVLRQPTFAEVAGLTFEPLRDIRVFHQQERNNFAHLLNQGSSLE